MQEQLTPKQQAIYEYLLFESKKNGYPPSIKDICAALGLKSTATVHSYLAVLEKKGYIRKYPTKNRTFEIIGKLEHSRNAETLKPPETAGQFVYQVPHNELRELGILKGDIVHCRRQLGADANQLAVLWENDAITLRPYEQVDFSRDEVLGVAIKLSRQFR
ncbi:MAG: helix-turn-helix domain-containing protein [Defluviitaleaceae bacterium]|nr:helix-turn-helix domain-containing protein [Defluviitaleaceae bacterium]